MTEHKSIDIKNYLSDSGWHILFSLMQVLILKGGKGVFSMCNICNEKLRWKHQSQIQVKSFQFYSVILKVHIMESLTYPSWSFLLIKQGHANESSCIPKAWLKRLLPESNRLKTQEICWHRGNTSIVIINSNNNCQLAFVTVFEMCPPLISQWSVLYDEWQYFTAKETMNIRALPVHVWIYSQNVSPACSLLRHQIWEKTYESSPSGLPDNQNRLFWWIISSQWFQS